MPLNNYQKHILRDIRTDENKIYGLKFISLTTGAGYSALDAYKKQTWVETNTFFSGSVLWNPYSNKSDTAGGFYKTADIIIVASRNYLTTAQSKDVKVEHENIKFRINRVIDCEDTQEIVITATRLQ